MNERKIQEKCDDASLVDLFIMIWKRRWLVFASLAIFVSAGVAYALLAPEVYEYSTVLAVGTTLKNIESGGTVAIESPKSLLEKLKTSYIPIAVNTLVDEEGSKIGKPRVSVISPKDSELVVLKSKGGTEQHEMYTALHQMLVDAVEKDHLEILSSARRELSSKIAESKIKLSEMENPTLVKVEKSVLLNGLNDEKRNLEKLKALHKVQMFALEAKLADEKSKLVNLQDRAKLIDIQLDLKEKERLLLERQVEEARASLEGVKTGQKSAVESVNDATKALTLMMVENQIDMQRTRLEGLEQRLNIDLKRQLGELSMSKDVNLREQGVQSKHVKEAESALSKYAADAKSELATAQESIATAENALLKFDIDRETIISQQKQVVEQLLGRKDALRNTKALAVAMRSVDRVSPKRALIVAGSGIIGGVFGLLLAFWLSFVEQVKSRQLQLAADQD